MRNGLFWGFMTAFAFFAFMYGGIYIFGWELTALVGSSLLAGILIACTFVICEKCKK